MPKPQCQCEHFDHLEDTHHHKTRHATHKYGAECEKVVVVHTPYGAFNMCPDCAKQTEFQYPEAF